MLVFREARHEESGPALLAALLQSLRELGAPGAARSRDLALAALLRSGELESGLADLESPTADAVAATTDALAEILLEQAPHVSLSELCDHLSHISMPERIEVSRAEGFAYYALHPLQYAELAGSLPREPGTAAVVGIRSIGTTLSAVVAAALRRCGVTAARITARPRGHPFDRKTEFSSRDLRWIAAQRARQAQFLVVDEGPGLSGSSFLSVGDALLQAGVARNRIAFLCAVQPQAQRLRARDGAQRWGEFRSYAVPPLPSPVEDSALGVGGGAWRRHLFDASFNWPSSWTTMERAKFLSRDGRRLFKFEGLGHFGLAVAERAQAAADAGFAPACESAANGYIAYERQCGLPATRMDLCPLLLD